MKHSLKAKKSAAFLLLALALSGCTLRNKGLIANLNYQDATFADISMEELTVQDEREKSGSAEMEIPAVPMPGKSGSAQPKLAQAHEDLIRQEILRHIGGGSHSFRVTFELMKGEKIYNATWKGNKKYVLVAARMTLTDGKLTQRASGEVKLEVNSPSASNDYLEKMYREAIRECVHQCFLSLKQL